MGRCCPSCRCRARALPRICHLSSGWQHRKRPDQWSVNHNENPAYVRYPGDCFRNGRSIGIAMSAFICPLATQNSCVRSCARTLQYDPSPAHGRWARLAWNHFRITCTTKRGKITALDTPGNCLCDYPFNNLVGIKNRYYDNYAGHLSSAKNSQGKFSCKDTLLAVQ